MDFARRRSVGEQSTDRRQKVKQMSVLHSAVFAGLGLGLAVLTPAAAVAAHAFATTNVPGHAAIDRKGMPSCR